MLFPQKDWQLTFGEQQCKPPFSNSLKVSLRTELLTSNLPQPSTLLSAKILLLFCINQPASVLESRGRGETHGPVMPPRSPAGGTPALAGAHLG